MMFVGESAHPTQGGGGGGGGGGGTQVALVRPLEIVVE
jgi:hypothetical protein